MAVASKFMEAFDQAAQAYESMRPSFRIDKRTLSEVFSPASAENMVYNPDDPRYG